MGCSVGLHLTLYTRPLAPLTPDTSMTKGVQCGSCYHCPIEGEEGKAEEEGLWQERALCLLAMVRMWR